MKKDSLKNVLANGISTTDGKITTVTSGNFVAKFENGFDTEFFTKRLRKIDAQMKRKTAIDTKELPTQKKLAKLTLHPEDCRTYYRLYNIALNAPFGLQPYVFENAKIFLQENGVTFATECDFYLAGIIPPKYTYGWEYVDTHDFGWEYSVEDLTPIDSLKIGTKVTCKNGYSGEIVATKIGRKKNVYKSFSWYGSTKRTYYTGKYQVWYVVQYGATKYDVFDADIKDIKRVA